MNSDLFCFKFLKHKKKAKMNPYEFIMDGDDEMNPIVSKVKTMAFWWIMKKQKKKVFNVFWVKEEGLTFFENKNNYFFFLFE